jgi:alpha-glucuronidase
MKRILFSLFLAPMLWAETGKEAWLLYPAITSAPVKARYASLPGSVVVLGDSQVLTSSSEELVRGVSGMLGKTLKPETSVTSGGAIVLGTIAEVKKALPSAALPASLKADGFHITWARAGAKSYLVVAGADERGVLYGTFALLRTVSLRKPIVGLKETQEPSAPVRWVNEWNNLDGSIERGYGGRSIFFEGNNVRQDLSRVREYARMLASLGINGCNINNVNANIRAISTEFLPQVARVAEVFRAWGIRTSLSLDFASPQRVGGLTTFDPLDPGVADFWKNKVDEIYKVIPDFGGFVLKADSEGRIGPSAYKRTHADAANVIARPLIPHGGVLFYRGFVYDNRMDWRELKNDRARAAYDNFASLDGKFEDNVIIQIKHGPIDFQVREPASPLFGALEKTSQAIELQITQEYFGQGHHMVFLVPMWKETLDFDMHAKGPGTPVKSLVSGKVFNRPNSGYVGVSNVGLDDNWYGHQLSQANLYGYGRLAWNPDLTSKQIIDEWTMQTFNHDPVVLRTMADLQLRSWPVFERYTGPLGAQTLTAIAGNHYGPAVESSERNGWGQWHRADEKGMGMNRTVATGTGFIGQYRPAVAKVFESIETCPDELLLWMHHVPYTHVLHSGKTVIQHIYDTHYQGAAEVEGFVKQWRALKGRVDDQRYGEVLAKLEYQAGHAQVWRDSINYWFLKTSGIKDKTGRAGNFPDRTEAEAMTLEGYQVIDVVPWETGSGEKAIACSGPAPKECSASFAYKGAAGTFQMDVQYFDQINGVSTYQAFVGDRKVDEWKAANTTPGTRPDGHSSTRRRINGVALKPGDVVKIHGVSDRLEAAALDYVEIHPPR